MKTHLVRVACLLLGVATSSTVASSKSLSEVQVLKMDEPLFPASMLMKGIISGEVQIVLSLDSEGKLTDWLVASYTRPEFADAVVRALKSSHFRPLMVDGTASSVRLPLTISFEARGVVVSQTILETIEARIEAARGGEHRISKTSRPKDLDAPVIPKHTVSPLYPVAFATSKSKGTVVIDFFVDDKGKVRMPTLVGGDQPGLAEAAAAALEEWQFEPPTRNGEPVAVRVKQKFIFEPKI